MDNNLVIDFFDIMDNIIRYPDDERTIRWKIIFFEKKIAGLEGNLRDDAVKMLEEMNRAKKGRRSRRYYNDAEICFVKNSYLISNRSEACLKYAWEAFRTGQYKVAKNAYTGE